MKTKKNSSPKVAVIMGSKSDWPTMKFCTETLKKLQVKFDAKIISAHRTPDRMYAFAKMLKKKIIQLLLPELVVPHIYLV